MEWPAGSCSTHQHAGVAHGWGRFQAVRDRRCGAVWKRQLCAWGAVLQRRQPSILVWRCVLCKAYAAWWHLLCLLVSVSRCLRLLRAFLLATALTDAFRSDWLTSPFIVAGLFGRKDSNPPAQQGNVPLAAGSVTAADGGAQDGANPDRNAAEDGYDADGDDDAGTMRRGYCFDWAAFCATFGDLPMEEAGVELFAEYAALYTRIAGQVGASFPARLDIQEATSISEQGTRFVTDFVTPILGLMNSAKIHKLLRHVLDSIKEHGNFKLENTAVNESLHNAENPFMSAPARTAVPSQPSS